MVGLYFKIFCAILFLCIFFFIKKGGMDRLFSERKINIFFSSAIFGYFLFTNNNIKISLFFLIKSIINCYYFVPLFCYFSIPSQSKNIYFFRYNARFNRRSAPGCSLISNLFLSFLACFRLFILFLLRVFKFGCLIFYIKPKITY